jgi:hypothetical protein
MERPYPGASMQDHPKPSETENELGATEHHER